VDLLGHWCLLTLKTDIVRGVVRLKVSILIALIIRTIINLRLRQEDLPRVLLLVKLAILRATIEVRQRDSWLVIPVRRMTKSVLLPFPLLLLYVGAHKAVVLLGIRNVLTVLT
jgi:hypothetical protein